jgi:hypothetical protein
MDEPVSQPQRPSRSPVEVLKGFFAGLVAGLLALLSGLVAVLGILLSVLPLLLVIAVIAAGVYLIVH